MKLFKALLTLVLTISSVSGGWLDTLQSPINVIEQKLVYAFGVEWPELTEQQSFEAWGLWSFGLIMGTGTSLT
jgi:hypothetical protein